MFVLFGVCGVGEVGLEICYNPPALGFPVLGLQVCGTMPNTSL